MTRNAAVTVPGTDSIRQCTGVEADHGVAPWRAGLWSCMRESVVVEAESRSLSLVLPLFPADGCVALGMLFHS